MLSGIISSFQITRYRLSIVIHSIKKGSELTEPLFIYLKFEFND